jgi:hypothetical protein
VIRFDHEPPRINGQYLFEIPLHSYIYSPPSNIFDAEEIQQQPFQLCGKIREICVDHEGGDRLVVSFEDSELIAVLRCDFETLGTKTMYLPV